MKNVIITGATSFLGREVVNGLLKREYRVYALVREHSPNLKKLPQNDRLVLISGSLDELDKIKNYTDSANVFLHFAWDGSGDAGRQNKEIQLKNTGYSMKALEIAQQLKCRQFIFPGSQAEYGICNTEITEETECCPISDYGKAKLKFSEEAFVFCKSVNMDFIHLRIFSVYGSGDRMGTLIDSCIRKFNQGETMKMGPCSQKWNYLYIEDFANIIMQLIEKHCPSGIYNVASHDTRTLKDFVKEVYELSNRSGSYSFGEEIAKPEGVPVLIPVINKLENVIGRYSFTTFNDGIKRTMRDVLTGGEK